MTTHARLNPTEDSLKLLSRETFAASLFFRFKENFVSIIVLTNRLFVNCELS